MIPSSVGFGCCRGGLRLIPTSDRLWKEYEGCTARFARTKLAQDNIDTEVLSVITLAGTFLWPIWARPTARGTKTGGERHIALPRNVCGCACLEVFDPNIT